MAEVFGDVVGEDVFCFGERAQVLGGDVHVLSFGGGS